MYIGELIFPITFNSGWQGGRDNYTNINLILLNLTLQQNVLGLWCIFFKFFIGLLILSIFSS